jgi:hypothetical protein
LSAGAIGDGVPALEKLGSDPVGGRVVALETRPRTLVDQGLDVRWQ